MSYRNPADLERIAEGLRQAGLPEGDDAPSPDVDGLSLPDKPSIAVLPFENLSDEREQEHFADGITEEIITTLSKVSKLFVIGRRRIWSGLRKACVRLACRKATTRRRPMWTA